MNTTVGSTYLEIVSGDITELGVDVVVNAANAELWMGAGVAGAIKRVGGEGIEREAVAQGPIRVGQAVATTGGALRAAWVIHAAVMGADLRTNATAIADATRSSLEMAEKVRSRTVALPAFGTGVGGFPLYQCASIMVAEVVRYLEERPRTRLRRILFAVYDDAARAAFKNALAGRSRF